MIELSGITGDADAEVSETFTVGLLSFPSSIFSSTSVESSLGSIVASTCVDMTRVHVKLNNNLLDLLGR